MASATYLQQAYLAYFGRPADVSGLSFYADKTEAQVVAAFSASPESQAFFGSLNTLAQINTIYQNLFNRPAEPAGLTYWANEINSGRLSLAQASMGILAGAQNDDALAVANKLAASAAFTAALDTTDEMIGYQGTAVVTSARAFLASVSSVAATLTAATAATALSATVASVVAAGTASSTAGQTFTLTASAPSVSEGNSGTSTLTYVLTLDKAPTSAVTINYQTLTTGTATAGTDYTTTAGVVTFAVGQTVATVSVTVAGDTAFEAAETIITSFSGSQLSATVTATGTITNDDVDPQIAIDAADAVATTTYNTALAAYNTAASAAATALTAATTANAAYDTAAAAVTTLAAATAASTLAATSATAATAAVTAAAAQTAAATALTTAAAATLSTADNTVASSAVTASTTAAAAAAATVTAAASDTAAAATAAATYVTQTFPLTTGVNSFTGGNSGDTFDGSLGGTGGNLQTLGSNDTLAGGLGTDSLTATLTATTVPTLTSIETLEITGNAALTLDLSNATGYTTLKNTGSTVGVLTMSSISSTAPALVVENTALGTTFAYTTAAVAGTTESVNLSVSNVTGAGLLTIAGIETINVTSSGVTANSINLAAANATTVNVSGTNAMTLAGMAAATTVNASSMTGALTAALAVAGTMTGGSGNDVLTGSAGNDVLNGGDGANTITAAAGVDSITGGAGTDRILFAAATNLTVADFVNGGAGANTLVATAVDIDTNSDLAVTADLAALGRVTNVQTLEVSGVGATAATTVLIDASQVSSAITTINVTDAVGVNDSTFTFNTGSSALNLAGVLGAPAVAAHVLVAAGTGTSDQVTVSNTNTAAADTFAARALTITGIETLAINTGATATNAQSTGATGWTPTTTNAAVTLNVTGANAFTTGVITPVGTGLLTINGSGMTAQAAGTTTLTTVAPVSTGTISIVGSAGQDILVGDINNSNTIIGGDGIDTLTGGSANDSLSGGAGNDTITTDAGVDYVDAGAGNDSIVVAANLTTADTILGGDGAADALSVTSAMVATTLTYTNISGIEQLTVSNALANNIVLSQVQAGINTVNLANTAIDSTITFDSGVAGTVNAAVDVGGAITVVSAGTGAADQITLANSSAAANSYAGRAITATGVETLVFNTSSTTAGTNKTAGVITITPTTLTAGQTLTVAGNGEFVATNVASTGTGLLTINASGITDLTASSGAGNAFSFSIGASALGVGGTQSITGSAGNDSITTGAFASTVIGGAGSDSITGGTANDNISSVSGENTIIGGGGRDTLTGGTGNDAITGNTGIDIITGNEGVDTIAGGGGNDTISAGAGNDVITATVAAADIVSIDGGEGNDGLTLTGWDLVTAEDVIAGGNGTADTLTVAVVNATAGSGANVTGWETLVITTAGTATQAMTTVMTGDTTINRIDFTGTANAAQGVTSASSALATLRTVSNTNTLSMARAVNTTSDSLTFGAATDANMTLAVLTVNNEESLTINAGAGVSKTMEVTALNAAQATTLTITGAQTSTVTTIGASAAETGFGTTARAITINGAAATGTVSVTAATALATQALTMTGSATANSTLTGGLGADSITGGAGNDSLTGGAGIDTISGGAGNDSLFGDAANDQLTGGLGEDVIRGGTGWDSITLTETTSAADRIDVTTAVAGTSESFGQSVAGLANDTGGDTVVGMTWGTDTIRLTATNVANFVHGTNTAIGTEGDVNDGTAASFLSSVGLVSFDNDVVFTDLDDVAINFSTSSATMTEALFEAALQYVITGAATADVITGGALADTISGGAGADTLTGGAGADNITVGTGADADIDMVDLVAVGNSGTFAAPTGTTIASTTFDVITGLTAADFIRLTAFTGTAAGTAANQVLDTDEVTVTADLSAAVLADNSITMLRGDNAAGVFTESATGADMLFVYDANSAVTTTAFEAIVLVGLGGATITVVAAAGGAIDIA